MKRRIFFNMCMLSLATLLLAFGSIFIICYKIIQEQNKNHIYIESLYISNAINAMDNNDDIIKYLNILENGSDSQIALLDSNNKILFDNVIKDQELNEYIDINELRKSIGKGKGYDGRLFINISEQTDYSAVVLDDGNVVIIAYTSDSAFMLFFDILPYVVIVLAMVMIIILSWVNSITNKIVGPINSMDLKEPNTNFEYEELTPLLNRIRNQNEEQQKNEQMRREFSANVSHELKTPLTSISGYAELIQNDMVKEEDVKGFAGKIYKEAVKLMEMVESIIKVSKLDEKKMIIEKDDVYLVDLVEDVKNTMMPLANKQKIIFNTACEDIHVDAVKIMMSELLVNLCANAIKYNRPNGKVDLKIYKRDNNVIIEVVDTGIGISQEDQERIFERFYRADKSHSRQTGGSGLGLAIVKHVVEFHGGTIDIDSEVDRGTKVTVTI